jgi:Leucine-rich repeat (LRR) protein
MKADDDTEQYIEHIRQTKDTSLNLSYRSLRAVPCAVRCCTCLESLFLNNNQLVIPPTDQLSTLQQLTTLSLEHNRLTILPDTLWQLTSLTRLNLSDNPLSHLPVELGRLLHLHELWLANLNLYDISLNIFAHLNQLEKLSLKGNHLRCLPNDIGHLIDLRWLTVEDNELNDLPDCLRDCAKLSYLNLNSNHFVHVPPVIGKITALDIVCFQRNAIAEINDETLLMFSTMTKVDLRENPLIDKPEHWRVGAIVSLVCHVVCSCSVFRDLNSSNSDDRSICPCRKKKINLNRIDRNPTTTIEH